MENNQNPQFPEDNMLPEALPEDTVLPELLPEDTSSDEMLPEFIPEDTALPELLPEAFAPEYTEDSPVDQNLIEQILSQQTTSPEEPAEAPVPLAAIPFEQPAPMEAPETEWTQDQAGSDPLAHDLLTSPELGNEITPDEHAMAWHGMTHPSEPEPEFDMGILDHPDYQEEPAAEEPAPDVLTEEEFLPEAPAPEPAVEEKKKAAKQRPVRKGRPKRKKGAGLFGIPHLLATCVWLAIILAVGVTLGRMIWVCAADVLAFGSEDKPVTVTIYEADTMEDIINKLYEAELIDYPQLFKLYADLSGAEEEIAPGIYDLNTRFDYMALVNHMSPSSTREVVEGLLIPEGYTCRQIFALMEEYKVCTAQDLAAYAASGELDEYWFLENVERGDQYCLEGYLFPDTYDFYKNSSPREVLEKMLDNFNHRFTEEMRLQLDTLNTRISNMMRKDGRSEEYIAEHQFTTRDVVIVASLIEKETASPSEGFTVASVIYNRLFNWGTNPSYLNIDASVIYALDGRTDLTAEDMRVDHPYNTYVNTGLTPGPISNPGLASLEAALAPTDTNYYYYVLNPETKVHQFSTTYEEHTQWVEQFRGME